MEYIVILIYILSAVVFTLLLHYFMKPIPINNLRRGYIPDFKLTTQPPPKPRYKEISIYHNDCRYKEGDEISNIQVWQFNNSIRLVYETSYTSCHPASLTLFPKSSFVGLWHVELKDIDVWK